MGAILWKLRNHQQIQILRKTKIGYGLYISHGGPVVVNPSTVIGNNCNLSQFVTIGSNEGKAAVIGDNVYVGPNTCMLRLVQEALLPRIFHQMQRRRETMQKC